MKLQQLKDKKILKKIPIAELLEFLFNNYTLLKMKGKTILFPGVLNMCLKLCWKIIENNMNHGDSKKLLSIYFYLKTLTVQK